MSARPPTVLIVDDEAPLRRVLEHVLAREGYRAIGAGSAETAYALLASEQADALLLDVRLPTTSGLALYLTIVHRWPALQGRIAIMTGDATTEDVGTWLDRHRCTVIHKPFDVSEVLQWLAGVLRLGEGGRAERGGAGA